MRRCVAPGLCHALISQPVLLGFSRFNAAHEQADARVGRQVQAQVTDAVRGHEPPASAAPAARATACKKGFGASGEAGGVEAGDSGLGNLIRTQWRASQASQHLPASWIGKKVKNDSNSLSVCATNDANKLNTVLPPMGERNSHKSRKASSFQNLKRRHGPSFSVEFIS